MNGPVQNDLPRQPAAAPRTPKSPKSPAPPAAKSANSTTAKSPVVNGNQAPKEPRGRSPNASARVATEKLRQEAAALQKRVAQFRSENQGLKSKVKRLEEDCARKSRQLDKLAQTAKDKAAAAQEQKKGDEALKQKCSRLEMQLKEKEDKLKKLQAIQRRSSETATPEKLHPAKSRLTSSQPRGSSAELVKLREQMDRISQENRRLTFQLKEKEQEIRRLKSQLQPAAPTKTPVKTPTRTPTKTPPLPSRGSSQRPASSSRAGSAATEPRKNVATAKRSNTFSVTRGPPQPDDKTSTSEITVESRSTLLNNKPQQSSASSNSKEASAPAPPVAKSKPTATVKPAASNPLPDPKAEAIRRQHAARKIQRVWRQHRRRASAASLAVSESSMLSETSNLSQGSQMSSKAKPMQHK
uniref:Actin cytoskeleton regulatory complex protein pan1 n=1 Tax=Rhipicephalus appendiculatus TaxID=34631 RepID=A0A131YJK4_RHIAP